MDIVISKGEARTLAARLRAATETVHISMTVREAMEIDREIRDAGFCGVYINGGNACDSIHDHFLTVAGMLETHANIPTEEEAQP